MREVAWQYGVGCACGVGRCRWGAGFVGRRLVNDLQHAGHQVRVIDSASIGLRAPRDRKVDVRDRGGLVDALEGCQVVFNLAAVHRDDVRQAKHYNEVNVEGAVNIFAACRELAIERAIFTSSVAVYGLWAPDILEERTPAPVNAYGCSKLDAEGVHRKWQEEDPERRSLVIVAADGGIRRVQPRQRIRTRSSDYGPTVCDGGQRTKPEVDGVRRKFKRVSGPFTQPRRWLPSIQLHR